jgi:hypothetical protein
MKVLSATLILALFASLPLTAESLTFSGSWGPQGITVVEEGPEALLLNFSMTRLGLETVVINGNEMTALSLPGVFLGGTPGAPDLPGMGRFFALPQGAEARLEIIKMRTERLMIDREIAPAAQIPLEWDKKTVFQRDMAIYDTDAFYPASPIRLSKPGNIRGVDTTIVSLTPFQYNPATGELLVHRDISLRIVFAGGNGRFGEDRLRSPHFDHIYKSHLINFASLPEIKTAIDRQNVGGNNGQTSGGNNRQTGGGKGSRLNGADYVIIVPDDPDFQAEAERLRDFRSRQGIMTEIYSKNVIGNTDVEFKDWIHNAVKTWPFPPVAVLLFGDAGTGQRELPIAMWNSTYTDNIYADVFGNDSLPDLIMARMTARTATEAQIMVDKVIDYESAPPTDPNFYANPMIAAGWQTDRWYVMCAEIVSGYFDLVQGKTTSREYALHSGIPGNFWSTNPNTAMLLDYFGPTGLGYIPATPAHLTDWGGNSTRINNDLNSGAFLAYHRDHGGNTNWVTPSYRTSDFPGLQNTHTPFCWSINCLSGSFHESSPCFAEAIHRLEKGMVGIVAATAVSYSFVNDTYVFGMMDALFPDFDPVYGGPPTAQEAPLQPGLAYLSGKYYLEASAWPSNPDKKEITYHLYHDHCDAFFALCSEVPSEFTVSHNNTLSPGAVSFTITADPGADICLTVDGPGGAPTIIGRGITVAGATTIPIMPQTGRKAVTVTLTKRNYRRHESKVYLHGPGSFTPYGNGLTGSGGLVPDLNGSGVPYMNEPFAVDITNGLGGAPGQVLVGASATVFPFMGGNLLVYPILASIPVTLNGSPGTPGAGSLSIPSTLALAGRSIYIQALLTDSAAPMGVSMSNGLEIQFP